MKMTPRSAQLLTFVLCFGFLYSTHPYAFQWSGLFADDGPEFFFPVQLKGLESLLDPVTGNFHLFGRVVFYLLSFLPLLWQPQACIFVAIGVASATLSFLVRPQFGFLCKSIYGRIAIALLLCLQPALPFLTSAISNIHYLFALLSVFLMMDLRIEFKRWKYLLLIFIFLSAPTSLLFLPVLIWVVAQRRDRLGWFTIGLGVFVLIKSLYLSRMGTHWDPAYFSNRLLEPKNVWAFPQIFVERLALYFFWVPVFGSEISKEMMREPNLYFYLGPTFFLIAGVWAWFRQRELNHHAGFLFASFNCAIGIVALLPLMRNYGQVVESLLRSSHFLLRETRHLFLADVLALLFYFSLLAQRWEKRDLVRRFLVVGFSLFTLFELAVNSDFWSTRYYGRVSGGDWPVVVKKIEQRIQIKKMSESFQDVNCVIKLLPINQGRPWHDMRCPPYDESTPSSGIVLPPRFQPN